MESFGQMQYSMQRSNPLFFFATGSSTPFHRLLPYETLRMYFYSFIEAYVKRAFYERTGSTVPTPKLAHDRTKRGYNWDDQMTDDLDYVEEDLEQYDVDLGISDDEDDIEDWQRD
jgi:hypothetical protein